MHTSGERRRWEGADHRVTHERRSVDICNHLVSIDLSVLFPQLRPKPSFFVRHLSGYNVALGARRLRHKLVIL